MKIGDLVRLNHKQVKGELGIVFHTGAGPKPLSRVIVMTGRYKGETIPFENRLLEIISESR